MLVMMKMVVMNVVIMGVVFMLISSASADGSEGASDGIVTIKMVRDGS